MAATHQELYQLVHGKSPPEHVVHRQSDAHVLSNGRGFIGAFDYTLQLQVGCPAGCLYCYVPASKWLTPPDVGRHWGYEVRDKRNAAVKLQRALESGRLADKTVYWSGVTDPYAASPALTQSIWRILNRINCRLRPRRIAVQSRFAVARDVELISEYSRSTKPADEGPPVVVSLSIGTDRNDVIRLWEKATPSFEQRMKTVNTLCEHGIFVVVTLSPFGPWRDLSGALRTLKDWGVQYVTVLFFKQHESYAATPPAFLEYLRQSWPQLLDPSWQSDRLAEIRKIFGAERVLLEQEGFSSLAAPQGVAAVER